MGDAANGKDAMDQIEKLQPQIVISDVVMPLMDMSILRWRYITAIRTSR